METPQNKLPVDAIDVGGGEKKPGMDCLQMQNSTAPRCNFHGRITYIPIGCSDRNIKSGPIVMLDVQH